MVERDTHEYFSGVSQSRADLKAVKGEAMPARRTCSAGLSSLALLVSSVLWAPAFARADTLTTFLVFGGYVTPTEGTFSGTLTANVTAGNLTAVDITFTVFAGEFNKLAESSPRGENWALTAYDAESDKLELTFNTIPNPGSLVNLSAGTIVSGQLLERDGIAISQDFNGALLPSDTAGAPVPEPSSLALLALGLLACLPIGLAQKKRTEPETAASGGFLSRKPSGLTRCARCAGFCSKVSEFRAVDTYGDTENDCKGLWCINPVTDKPSGALGCYRTRCEIGIPSCVTRLITAQPIRASVF